jgi:hypothetical protein
MVTLECTICRKQYEARYANKLYCSKACKQKAWRAKQKAERAKQKAELAGQAPRYDALETGLARALPRSGAKAAELRRRAGDDCTELIFELVATVLHEMRAGATSATKAEGVPMK